MVVARVNEPLLFTAEEMADIADELGRCELIDGRIVSMAPTGAPHGEIEIEVAFHLRVWAKATGRGRVMGGEVGLFIRRQPDTVRAADVLFISHERYARRGPSGYLDVAPELIVEIVSPEDRFSQMTEKLADYFSAGVDRVWILDPRVKRVFAYRSVTDVTVVEASETLTDEAVLPGFEVRVGDLFPE
ncbi:MAG: Uma2 family endonuclease [Thermoanaerobaculia bacterium]|nr:Uma2 family endonuclease [Thermoanaerobaculia bacterium]